MRLIALYGFALIAVLTSGTGCFGSGVTNVTHAPPKGKLGKEGKVGFSYNPSSVSPTITFELDAAMMKGTKQRIFIDPGQPQDTIFESSDPSIVAVRVQSTSRTADGPIEVDFLQFEAKAPGNVEIRLKSAAGELIERLDVAVEMPRAVTISAKTTTVKVGETVAFQAVATNADGKRLQAFSGWEFKGDAPKVATVSTPCFPFESCFYGSADAITVKGLAAGTVNVSATGAGVTGTLAVTVTP